MTAQIDFYETMVRHPDHDTSIDAARSVLSAIDALRESVFEIIVERGPITALEIEDLPQFKRYAPTTIRKRASELLNGDQSRGIAPRIRVHDRRTVTLSDGRQGRAMSYVALDT